MSTSSMHVAKTGLNAQQTRMQIIANNLANVSTNGFKRDRANFETLLYQVRRVAGDQVTAEANLTSSFSVGTGARIVNTQKNMSQETIRTKKKTDFRSIMCCCNAGNFLSMSERKN